MLDTPHTIHGATLESETDYVLVSLSQKKTAGEGAPSLLRENKSCFQFSWCCNSTWSPKKRAVFELLLLSLFKALHHGGKMVSGGQGPQSCFRTAAS